MVAGTASLIFNMQQGNGGNQQGSGGNQQGNGGNGPNQAAWAIAHAQFVGLNMGNGRLNVNWTLTALNPLQGLN
jgi:hypothetical protein